MFVEQQGQGVECYRGGKCCSGVVLLCTIVNHHKPPFGRIYFFPFSKHQTRKCKLDVLASSHAPKVPLPTYRWPCWSGGSPSGTQPIEWVVVIRHWLWKVTHIESVGQACPFVSGFSVFRYTRPILYSRKIFNISFQQILQITKHGNIFQLFNPIFTEWFEQTSYYNDLTRLTASPRCMDQLIFVGRKLILDKCSTVRIHRFSRSSQRMGSSLFYNEFQLCDISICRAMLL